VVCAWRSSSLPQPRIALLLLLTAAPVAPLIAQGGVTPPRPVLVDSSAHRPSPLGFFFRSLAIPGWGQASLDRKLTAGLFVAFEGLSVSMALKASNELRYLSVADSATAESRRAERQDWIVLIVFNHLFSALEAYVSAHLVDFPRDLRIRALPGSRPGIGVSIGLPHT
jgi:hypothetical protein